MVDLRRDTVPAVANKNIANTRGYLFSKIYQHSTTSQIRKGNFFVFSQEKDKEGALLNENLEYLDSLQNLQDKQVIFQTGRFSYNGGDKGSLSLHSIFFCNATSFTSQNSGTVSELVSPMLNELLQLVYRRSIKIILRHFRSTNVSSKDIDQSIRNILANRDAYWSPLPNNLTFHPRDYLFGMETSIPIPDLAQEYFIEHLSKVLNDSSEMLFLGENLFIYLDVEKFHFFLLGLCREINDFWLPQFVAAGLHVPGLSQSEELFSKFIKFINGSNDRMENMTIVQEKEALQEIITQVESVSHLAYAIQQTTKANVARLLHIVNLLAKHCLHELEQEESGLGQKIYKKMYTLNARSNDLLDLFFCVSDEGKKKFGQTGWQSISENPNVVEKEYYDREGVQYILFLQNHRKLRKLIRKVATQEVLPNKMISFFILDYIYFDFAAFQKEYQKDVLLTGDIYYCQRVLLRFYYPMYRRLLIWLLLQPRSESLLDGARASMYRAQEKWKEHWLQKKEIQKEQKGHEELAEGKTTQLSRQADTGKAGKGTAKIMQRINQAYTIDQRIPMMSDYMIKGKQGNNRYVQLLINNKTLCSLSLHENDKKKVRPIHHHDHQAMMDTRLLIYGQEQDIQKNKLDILLVVKKSLEAPKTDIEYYKGLRIANYMAKYLSEKDAKDANVEADDVSKRFRELV